MVEVEPAHEKYSVVKFEEISLGLVGLHSSQVVWILYSNFF